MSNVHLIQILETFTNSRHYISCRIMVTSQNGPISRDFQQHRVLGKKYTVHPKWQYLKKKHTHKNDTNQLYSLANVIKQSEKSVVNVVLDISFFLQLFIADKKNLKHFLYARRVLGNTSWYKLSIRNKNIFFHIGHKFN